MAKEEAQEIWGALRTVSAALDGFSSPTESPMPCSTGGLESRVAKIEEEVKQLQADFQNQEERLQLLGKLMLDKGVSTSGKATFSKPVGASKSTVGNLAKPATKKKEASRTSQLELGFATADACVPASLKPFPKLVGALLLSLPEWEYKAVDASNDVSARFLARYHLRSVLPLEELNRKISQAVTLLREWFEYGR